jgi:regulator of sirC expression with transglutaminase-like and TPR domain
VRTVEGPHRYFDPFGGGREVSVDEARALFERLTRDQVPWHDSFLEPTTAEHIVVRMLNNLRSIFHGRADELRLGLVMQMCAQIPHLAASERDEITAATALFN